MAPIETNSISAASIPEGRKGDRPESDNGSIAAYMMLQKLRLGLQR